MRFSYVIFSLFLISLGLFSSCEKDAKKLNNPTINRGLQHPSLILTKQGVQDIKAQLGHIPIFDKTLAVTKKEVDAEILAGIDVPIPKDYSGGYTHERHKKNHLMMQKAGVLFQLLGDEKYAVYVRDMLLEYAKMYPTLPLHPQTRSYARGKLFWQCLNDANWLVYTSQAYDCIYDWLSKDDRDFLEKDLFKPFADFISIGNPQFFNRIHNHSTWGNAAVGMIALVMDDDRLLNRALYGIKDDHLKEGMKDNDGGLIKVKGEKAGFLANIEEPFSPDGYYTEGPYYQRYAMYPFLIFAEALQNVKPNLEIFKYKDSVLIKAVSTLLNLSNKNGDFFTLNDAQKGMSYYSKSVVSSVDIAYKFGGEDPKLLDIANKQQVVTLDDAGLAVAKGIEEGKTKPFIKKSVNLSDGPEGKQGGVGILRSNDLELVFKYTAQGLSHGHYDKLSFSLFNNSNEVLQDYGLVRFVNIEQKGGGNYLKENKTWAKQTIAHNTLVQNESSQFKGKYEIGSKHHSDLFFFDAKNSSIKIVSAKEDNAYSGTQLHRTMAIINDDEFEKPFVIDVLQVQSKTKNQYDLPFYYFGQIMETNFDYKVNSELKPLGEKDGYQYLWKIGEGKPTSNNVKFSWLNQGVFYTLTTVATKNDNLIFAKIGANDPHFNLRNDPAFILRRKDTQNTIFVSVIEPHGSYSPVSELALNSKSIISNLEVLTNTPEFVSIKIKTVNGKSKLLMLANDVVSKTSKHKLKLNDKVYQWIGSYYYTNIN
ncbi:alginate lyase family protein [Lutibacter sp.]|uniref:alginate lyase family protein n=1 Tax=Lutibacter sp. TaxID=1925666 RepID=UPI0025C1C82F|nr:alginate lyase family protein [Lutibacter sp.]MCF6181282.1 heparinase II/III family protein [Lutibacter sp.]